MKPSLTFDAIFAALTVLSVGAGCSKADRAAAEPPAAAPAQAAPPPAAEPVATAAASATASAPPAPSPPKIGAATAVDAGTERSLGKPAGGGKGGSASCGATGCSAEMRKGGK